MPLPIHFANVSNTNQPGNDLVPQALRAALINLSLSLPQSELSRLYSAIETVLPSTPNRIVQFISAYDDEGASTIAFETAIVAARLIGKRVLFIDTGAARASAQKSLPASGVPLDTLLLTGRPPHEAIVQAVGTDLYFAVLRRREKNGVSSVSLSAIESALKNLRSSFDVIIVDSQDILQDAFGMALSKLVDGSILVIEAERVRAPVALESRRQIEAGGGHVIGAVLSKRRLYIPKFLYRLLYRHDAL